MFLSPDHRKISTADVGVRRILSIEDITIKWSQGVRIRYIGQDCDLQFSIVFRIVIASATALVNTRRSDLAIQTYAIGSSYYPLKFARRSLSML